MDAVWGYLGLGMFDEAVAALGEIKVPPYAQTRVLEFRYAISTDNDRWDIAEDAAHQLAMLDGSPMWWDNWAYATRRCRSIEASQTVLLEAETIHPRSALIQFSLACCACRMGDLDAAKLRVSAAISLDGKFRKETLDDPDLEPLWADIAEGLTTG
jgi:hypothetical protein